MDSMRLSTKQSGIDEMTDALKKFSMLVDLYSDDRVNEKLFISELARFEEIDWLQENVFNQLLAYYTLASAYGVLKSKKLDYTKAYYQNEYVYKEISYYHNLHYVVSRVKKEQWAALYWSAFRLWCRAYLCLANAYDHLGRFCEAQQFYNLAVLDKNLMNNVEINRGFSYANMHTFWKEEEPWIVRKAQILMKKHSKTFDVIAPEQKARVCSWMAPSFDAPLVDFSQIDNGEFEKWVNENYLRINRFCDVEPLSSLSMDDNVKLGIIDDTKERKQLFETSFDEIKGSYIETRRLAFTAIEGEEGVKAELLKMTYKNFYSLLDKIAVFIKAYLNLPIEVHKVDFATVWYNKKRTSVRTEFMGYTENLSLLALYNVMLDVYGSRIFDYVIDEQTKDLQRIRNYIEHKVVAIRDGAMEYDEYKLSISKNELSINTIRLAQLVRCAIIYLCNFVMHAEYDKRLDDDSSK